MKGQLLKFVLLCDGDEDKAVQSIVEVLEWRRENRIDFILNHVEWVPKEFFDKGLAFFRNRNKQGDPIGVITMRKYSPVKERFPDFQKYIFYVLECARCLVVPPYYQICVIVDMNGVSMANMELSLAPFFRDLVFKYYPESVSACKEHKPV
jgi:hypothetical protein